MNKIQRCVLVALMAASLVSGIDSSSGLPKEKVAQFNNQEMELVKAQLDINSKWGELRANMTEAMRGKMSSNIVKDQIKLGKAWDKLYQEEEKAMEEWKKLSMKQKLAGLVDTFKKEGAAKEIWGDKAAAKSSAMNRVTVHIDTKNSLVGIYTDQVDVSGRPVLQWEMNTQSGHIIETTRSKDGQQVKVTEKDSPVRSHQPSQAYNYQNHVQYKTSALAGNSDFDLTTSGSKIIDIDGEMQDVEKQRDIAFKIMFFFVSFILGTYAILYWIFRCVENKRQEDALKEGIKNQRFVSPQNMQQRTFVDFIVGQLDNDSMVINPYARHAGPVTAGNTSRRVPAQQPAQRNCDYSAFGASNLANLEERGRFDDF